MFFVQKAEKGRKSKKIAATLSQKFFLFAPEHWPSFLFPEKRHSQFCIQFLADFSFSAFLYKNIEKAYFNQRLECAEPKHWSKYTTNMISKVLNVTSD